MACANVANLLLARASARLREFSVRIAIGAGRFSLIQQMLTESLMLTMASSLSGLALSVLFVRWIRSLPGSTIPRPEAVSIDWRVTLFALLMACLTGLVFGVLPSLPF
jgi:ABC-type antimicrobial peptide transport system permease subunit